MPCNRLRSCSAFLFLVSHMFYSCSHVGPIAALRAVCELSHFFGAVPFNDDCRSDYCCGQTDDNHWAGRVVPGLEDKRLCEQVIPDSREPFLLACRCRAGAAMFGADPRFQQSNLI